MEKTYIEDIGNMQLLKFTKMEEFKEKVELVITLKTYNKGFVIYDDHSLFGQGDGYALFDLQGKYSKISFDVGRTNEYEKQDVSLKVYLDNEYVEEYSLNAESPPITLEINLNYANSLKLEITGGSRVKYGFANVILHY